MVSRADSGGGPGADGIQLNKLCDLDDFAHPSRIAAMLRAMPYFAGVPGYPRGMEHRKHWEYAQLLCGLAQLGAVHPEAVVLSVGAGHEEPVFELTNHVRQVVATDLYGEGRFKRLEGDARMLVDPDSFARGPWNRRRLAVQYMSGLDLRFEDASFDVAFSLSSIEHFGGVAAAAAALAEMARVVRPGGVVALTTECVVNGAADHEGRGLAVFAPTTIDAICSGAPALELVEPIDYSLGPATVASSRPLSRELANARRGTPEFPAIVVEDWGRCWTSVSLFLRRLPT